MGYTNPKEVKVLAQVWLNALHEGEFRVETESHKAAKALRLALYRLRTQVLNGKLANPELKKAITECSLSLGGLEVIAYRKTARDFIAKAGEEMEGGSLKRVLEQANALIPSSEECEESEGGPGVGKPANPYF